MRYSAIPKLEFLYNRSNGEMNQWKLKDLGDSKVMQSFLKAKADNEAAETGYRLGIQTLEERRQSMVLSLESCKQRALEIRQEGMESSLSNFNQFSGLLHDELKTKSIVS